MKAIRTECQLTGFSSRADGSLGFRGVTPELSSAEKVALMDLQNVLVEMLVYPKDDKQSEVVEVKNQLEGKTPSQRLRAALFIYWKQEGEKESFDAFYAHHMEKLIDFVKAKLEQE